MVEGTERKPGQSRNSTGPSFMAISPMSSNPTGKTNDSQTEACQECVKTNSDRSLL